MTNQVLCQIIVAILTNWVDIPNTSPEVQAGFVFQQRVLLVQFEGHVFTNILEQALQPQAQFRAKPKMYDPSWNITVPAAPLLSTAETISPALPPIPETRDATGPPVDGTKPIEAKP